MDNPHRPKSSKALAGWQPVSQSERAGRALLGRALLGRKFVLLEMLLGQFHVHGLDVSHLRLGLCHGLLPQQYRPPEDRICHLPARS